MKKIQLIAMCLLMSAVTMVGCSTNKDTMKNDTKKSDVKKEMLFQDDAGRKVNIKNKITRIAPSGPLAQQVLMSIAPEKVVAIAQPIKDKTSKKVLSKFVDLPKIGQIYGKLAFNVESLVEANPDIVIDIGEAKKSIVKDMDTVEKKAGKPAVFIEMKLDNAKEAYLKLGKLLGEEEKAKKLADYIEKLQNETKEGMKKIGDKKKSFVYLTGKDGLGSNPKGSFHMQLLDLLGENKFVSKEKSAKGGSNKISMEELVKMNPDVVIFGPDGIYDKVKNEPVFSELKAIKEGKFVKAPAIPYNWLGFPPSVNRYLGMMWIEKVFYPDVFTYNLEDRVKEYFDLFYGYKLTTDEYKEIVKDSFFR